MSRSALPDPDEPGLDEEMRAYRRALAEIDQMSPEELFQIAVDAGILTPDGKLTPRYDRQEPYEYGPWAGLTLGEDGNPVT